MHHPKHRKHVEDAWGWVCSVGPTPRLLGIPHNSLCGHRIFTLTFFSFPQQKISMYFQLSAVIFSAPLGSYLFTPTLNLLAEAKGGWGWSWNSTGPTTRRPLATRCWKPCSGHPGKTAQTGTPRHLRRQHRPHLPWV